MQQGARYGTTTHSRKVVQDSDAYGPIGRRRDKRGSPVEPQAIDMALVPACRSVGARAALNILTNATKGFFGTVCVRDCREARP